jgi:hypothetical protein
MKLADRLKEMIERSWLRADGRRPIKTGQVKHDYLHHLFFCLEWLNDGIVEGLDDELV